MRGRPLSPITEFRHAFSCGPEHPSTWGLRFFLVEDFVEAEWRPSEATQGGNGIVHGGALATAQDDAAAFAMVALAGQMGFTRRLDVAYHRPVRVGAPVRVRGRALEVGARSGRFATEVLLGSGEAASTAVAEYAFVDARVAEAVFGRPLSEPLLRWLSLGIEERKRFAVQWGEDHAAGLAGT